MPHSYLDQEQQGIARAKYDFHAKTNVEISFKKVNNLQVELHNNYNIVILFREKS